MLGLATFGVISLALIWGYAFRDFPNVAEGSSELGFTDTGHVVLLACYMPLLLWAPLLAAVTYATTAARSGRRACRPTAPSMATLTLAAATSLAPEPSPSTSCAVVGPIISAPLRITPTSRTELERLHPVAQRAPLRSAARARAR